MSSECWLYLYENRELRSIYIGIADKMERVFGGHNQKATELRDTPGTNILQTRLPFSSRADARKAEAIAIHVASFAGLTIYQEGEDSTPITTTNISGLMSSRELEPAILDRDECVDLADFNGTIFVSISARDDTGELSAFGGHSGADFAPRAQRWWCVAAYKRARIKHLVAVLKSSGNLILGSWKVDTDGEWNCMPDAELQEGRWRKAIEIPLTNASEDDFGGIKGMRVSGLRMNSSVGYSPDFRA